MASAGLATWAGLIPAVIITTAATHVAIPKCFNVFMFSPVEFEGINAVPVRKVQWIRNKAGKHNLSFSFVRGTA
jgi:hypothetical protein